MISENLRTFPDPFLRKRSQEVVLPDESLKDLVRDMFETMDTEGGIGFAAPQIGVGKRVVVVSVEEKEFERLVLFNPVIVSFSSETVLFEEGCLSVPGVRADVERPSSVVVRGITRSGRLVEIAAVEMVARVLQHEIDHLDGVLFIDRLGHDEKTKVEQGLLRLRQGQRGAGSPLAGSTFAEPRSTGTIT